MRFRSAPENTILAAADKGVPQVKTEIKDAAGAFQNWFPYLLGGSWGWSVDQPIAEARLTLRRDNGLPNSLSPFRGDSTLNIGGAAIDVGRDLRISPATTAYGISPVAGDYKLLFDGKTADLDFAKERMDLLARDHGGALVKKQIRTATQFRSEAGEPLENVIQSILDTWSPGVILDTPFPPGFLVKSIDWGKGSLFEAIRTAAGSIGWDVRYVWSNTWNEFRLTLFEPDRDKTVPDWTFAKNRILAINQLRLSDENVRNFIRVSYLNPDSKQREEVFASDPVSIARFGEQWMEIEEADDSTVNSLAEAQALANAALSDLAWPIAEKQVEIPFFWPIEVNDLVRFTANDIHSDEDIDLAVTGVDHRFESRQARTVLSVRGKPAGFYKDWLRRSKTRDQIDLTDELTLKNFRDTSWTDTSVTYSWQPGSLVELVFVYDHVFTQPYPLDPWPPADAAPTSILSTAETTYTALIPKVGERRYLQFEPRASAVSGLAPGQLRRTYVDAPAPVISAVLDAVETNALVDLTLQVRATPAAYPIAATVYEGSKTGTVLATHSFTADATITKLDYAALGGRAAAATDKKFFYAKLVDVAGDEVWAEDFVSVPGTGAIKSVAQFLAAIVPPEIVTSLPALPNATYPAGRLVVLTSDNKLYRSTGTTWTKATDGADILANSIVAGTLTTGAVVASNINVTELSAISADLGEITAGEMHNAGDTAGVLLDGALPGTWTRYLDLTADAGDSFLKHDKLDLKYDGTAIFKGKMVLQDTTGADAGEIVGSSSGAGQSTLTVTAAYDVKLILAGLVGSGLNRVASIEGAAFDVKNSLLVTAGGSQLFRDAANVTHGMTTIQTTDTVGAIFPEAITGGLKVQGLSEAATALTLQSLGTGDITTKTTAALASSVLTAAKASGTGIANLATNSNIFAVRNNTTTRFILDGDGDSHQDVGTAWTNFDTHDDIALLTCLSAEVSRQDDPVRQHLASWLDSHKPELERLKLVTFNEDGHHFVNMSRLSMLLVGAVRQLGARLDALESRLLASGA